MNKEKATKIDIITELSFDSQKFEPDISFEQKLRNKFIKKSLGQKQSFFDLKIFRLSLLTFTITLFLSSFILYFLSISNQNNSFKTTAREVYQNNSLTNLLFISNPEDLSIEEYLNIAKIPIYSDSEREFIHQTEITIEKIDNKYKCKELEKFYNVDKIIVFEYFNGTDLRFKVHTFNDNTETGLLIFDGEKYYSQKGREFSENILKLNLVNDISTNNLPRNSSLSSNSISWSEKIECDSQTVNIDNTIYFDANHNITELDKKIKKDGDDSILLKLNFNKKNLTQDEIIEIDQLFKL